MKPLIMVLAAVVVAGIATYGQGADTSEVVEREFAPGGTVRMRLASGDYVVRRSAGDRIVVRLHADRPRHRKHVRAEIDISGTIATVQTHGDMDDYHVVIEIPARSDLHLRMRAGEVTVKGIEGNKDVEMTAGELNIDVVPETYSRVRASVTFGELESRALRVSKEGIGRSFDWRGSGRYTLRARLFAGEVNLD